MHFNPDIAETQYVFSAFPAWKVSVKLKVLWCCRTEQLLNLTLPVTVLSPRELENLSLHPA